MIELLCVLDASENNGRMTPVVLAACSPLCAPFLLPKTCIRVDAVDSVDI